MPRQGVWLLFAVVALAVFCASCEEKFTRPRYETIHIGMTEFEVKQILGRPEVKFSDSWSYIHEEPFYKAIIQFHEGRVSNKAWYDEKEMDTYPDLSK